MPTPVRAGSPSLAAAELHPCPVDGDDHTAMVEQCDLGVVHGAGPVRRVVSPPVEHADGLEDPIVINGHRSPPGRHIAPRSLVLWI